MKSEELRVRADSVVVEVRDTVKEVTTITIDRNDRGDTLRLTQVTDRSRFRERDNIAKQQTKEVVVRDTVYIEKRDSVFVENTNLAKPTNLQSGKTALHTTLKWIFWIIIGLIGLIVTVKVCHQR